MANQKNIKSRGKINFSKYFQEFKEGDKVAIVKDLSICSCFPDRIQGKSGVILERRGKAYIVRLMDGNKAKFHIVEPLHLKKLI
jgi:large subunit ribosomal protein L21e